MAAHGQADEYANKLECQVERSGGFVRWSV